MNIDVGNKVRNIRKSKNMSISVLAEKSELSTGLISQIERNKVVPSIVAMWKICNALDINISNFFEEDNEYSNCIVRKEDRKKIYTSDSTKFYELLMPNLNNKKIEFILVTLDNYEKHYNDMLTHEGEECGYIIEGNMKLTLGENQYILNKGDSFYFNSTIPHIYESHDCDKCILICAMTPVSF